MVTRRLSSESPAPAPAPPPAPRLIEDVNMVKWQLLCVWPVCLGQLYVLCLLMMLLLVWLFLHSKRMPGEVYRSISVLLIKH